MFPVRVMLMRTAFSTSRLSLSCPCWAFQFFTVPASVSAAKMTTVSHTLTVSQAVKKNHRELEGYHNAIVKSDDPDERMRFQNQFTWELARHAVSEELIVYPAFEKYLEDGAAMAEKDRVQHHVEIGRAHV